MPPTPTRPDYSNDFERVSFWPRASLLQRLLWGSSHGLLALSFLALRPGWLLGTAVLGMLTGHAAWRRPRPAPPFAIGPAGDIHLPPAAAGDYRVRQAEVGPWHVYLVLKGSGPVVKLCVYKDALEAPAWAALRRRLLVAADIG